MPTISKQSIAHLLAHYRTITHSLRLAIETDDAELIAKLDHDVSELFDSIYALTPTTREDTAELLLFMADQLALFSDNPEFVEQSKARMREVVEGALKP